MEAMAGLTIWVSPSAQLKLARRCAECFLTVFLLISFLNVIAECDDKPQGGTITSSLGIPPQGQANPIHTTDKAASEPLVVTLSAKTHELLEESNIEEAMATQRQLVSLLETLVGKTHWQTKNEQAFLVELERVSKFANQEQKTYLVAGQRWIDGCNEMALENYDNAKPLLEKALEGYFLLLGDNCVSTVATLEHLGILHLMKEDPSSKAKEYFIRAVAARKAIVGEDHPDYANAMTLVAVACSQLKEYDQAEVFLRDALSRDRKIFGEKNVRYAEGLGRLSMIMIEKNKLPEAEALCLQAITIAEQIQAQNTPLMASYLFNMANVHIAYGEYGDAEISLRRSLMLYENGLPPWSPTIAKVLDRYAWLLHKLDRSEEAKAMETRATAIRAQLP
jgi:tetratricopeptide (TPR) repeat protein